MNFDERAELRKTDPARFEREQKALSSKTRRPTMARTGKFGNFYFDPEVFTGYISERDPSTPC